MATIVSREVRAGATEVQILRNPEVRQHLRVLLAARPDSAKERFDWPIGEPLTHPRTGQVVASGGAGDNSRITECP